ncbi:MAG: TetR/AcrR family transcriptional regulator C-terminal domain-containing protein [Rhodothermales bacterium]|nr:TetR/AcrR family transcriptional regulator C-terminal domain-containing protein [Rhodothermales bacterium]MBO6778663.1 TetR/AcrR family transcriptional regulator C-terminal domain-containing protein [Rhodothermales bacterium]
MSRRTPLTRDRVLRAAVRVADEHGLDALTMRRLGKELGVEAMSLYNHVANKDAVLDGIVDLTVGEIAVPSTMSGWRSAMELRCRSARAVLLAHRWLAGLLMSRVNTGPNMLRYVDGTIGALRAGGFSIDLVDQAWGILDSYVYGFVLQELDFPIEEDAYAETAAAYLPMLETQALPHLTEMTRAVAERRHHGRRDFELGLQLVLDGLERLLDGSEGGRAI